MNEGGKIEVALHVPDAKAVDDIRDPWLRALTADALDTGTDPEKLLRLERELSRLGAHKAAAAIGKKARQIRHSEVVEKKLAFELLGDKASAEAARKLILP